MSEKFTQSFEQFSSGLGATDVLLYAGVALFLWYLFRDKMGGIKDIVTNLINTKLCKKNLAPNKLFHPSLLPTVAPPQAVSKEDIFFQLVSCWKQMRDLAVQANCSEAIKAIDLMFPHLSPNSCNKPQGEVK